MAVYCNAGPIVRYGLVLCLDAGNPKSYSGSGTTWTDLSGNGNNGTLTNMDGTNLDSASGGSLTFDGVDDYIIVQHKEWQNLDSWSVSMWINPNIIFDAESILFEKGGNLGYQLSLSTSGNLIFKDRGETNTISTTNDPVSILQWYNVVVTASPAGLQLYLNTNLEVSNTTAFGGNTSGNVLCIGGKQNISVLEKYFNGNIACFSFYSTVLTEQEILSNYNALRPRFIATGSDPLQAISGDIMTENDNILLTENDEVLILP